MIELDNRLHISLLLSDSGILAYDSLLIDLRSLSIFNLIFRSILYTHGYGPNTFNQFFLYFRTNYSSWELLEEGIQFSLCRNLLHHESNICLIVTEQFSYLLFVNFITRSFGNNRQLIIIFRFLQRSYSQFLLFFQVLVHQPNLRVLKV